MEGVAGVTAMETKARELTFNVAEPKIDPKVALIVVEPPFKPLAKPVVLMLAWAG